MGRGREHARHGGAPKDLSWIVGRHFIYTYANGWQYEMYVKTPARSHESAGEDYLWWQTQDRNAVKRINTLIRDVERNGNELRITDGHRLFYTIIEDEIRYCCMPQLGVQVTRSDTCGPSRRAMR